MVRNSVLENMDIYSKEELKFIFTKLKQYIAPIVTSVYIPSREQMEILNQYAPEFKVRFKVETPGAEKIMPISYEQYINGEEIFQDIINGINPEWSDIQKYKYLYNKMGQILSYDLNVLPEYNLLMQCDLRQNKLARNYFTSISKNLGVCTSFAGCYDYLCYKKDLESDMISQGDHSYNVISPTNGQKDYLADVTFDSARLKSGMSTTSFAVSLEEFEEGGKRCLKRTDVNTNLIGFLTKEGIEEIDDSIGYLNEFGGKYTDEKIYNLACNLKGTNTEKLEEFIGKINSLKYVGRPKAYDFGEIIDMAISNSTDKPFQEVINKYECYIKQGKEIETTILMELMEKEESYYCIFDSTRMQFQKIGKETLKKYFMRGLLNMYPDSEVAFGKKHKDTSLLKRGVEEGNLRNNTCQK